ncbi:unnamed protein product [Nezara viridula]|uniref:Uncharacterized protein n=1 Tax=Nezara viridula TaxID=85310 RepID=A0A9P0HB88_NEZVI|nr:unnamed protein product [Nezara viridula]
MDRSPIRRSGGRWRIRDSFVTTFPLPELAKGSGTKKGLITSIDWSLPLSTGRIWEMSFDSMAAWGSFHPSQTGSSHISAFKLHKIMEQTGS